MRSRLSDVVSNMALGVVALCTLVATYHVVLRAPDGAGPANGMREIRNWRTVAVGTNRVGPMTAPVVLTEFTDFQCPACRRASNVLAALHAKFPDDLQIIYRHSPIEQLHPFARRAAIASECAAKQGMFRQFHDKLFELQDSIPVMPLSHFAQLAGVPRQLDFISCLADPSVDSIVERDLAAGREVRLRGTPTILINGTLFDGAPPFAVLDSVVTVAVARAGHQVRQR